MANRVLVIDPHPARDSIAVEFVGNKVRGIYSISDTICCANTLKYAKYTKVILEDQWFGKNPKIMKDIAVTRGKYQGMAELLGIPVSIIAPLEWNRYNFGSRPDKAKKIQAYLKAYELLGIKRSDDNAEDAADCLFMYLAVTNKELEDIKPWKS